MSDYMKITKYFRHCINIGPVLLFVCSLFSSCDNERTDDIVANTPLKFTAEIVQPQSRAAGKDAWVGGEKIGIISDETTNTMEYVLDASGNATPVDKYNTIYLNGNEINIKAWYPFMVGRQLYDVSNQEAGYSDFDFLFASENISTGNTVNLRFRHIMAKLELTAIAGNGVTQDEVDGALISIYGDTEAAIYQGEIENADQSDGEIYPYYDSSAKKYEAVIVPQNMTGKPLLRVGIGGRMFTYTPQTEDAGNLKAGYRYSFAITVNADGLEVQEVRGSSWGYGDEEDVSVVKFVTYTAFDVKTGDYIYSDGTTSDGGLRKRYSDGRTPVIANPKPGPIDGKPISGIVFWTPKDTDPTGRATPASLKDDKIMANDFPNCTHGLAVSLKMLTEDRFQGQYESIAQNFQNTSNFNPTNKAEYVSIACNYEPDEAFDTNRILGYQNTKVLLAYNEYCKNNNREGYIVRPVRELAALEMTNPAPANSTGWYLPSVKELYVLCDKDADNITFYPGKNTETKDIVNASILAAGGNELESCDYTSSTETTLFSQLQFIVRFSSGYAFYIQKDLIPLDYVAVCAF